MPQFANPVTVLPGAELDLVADNRGLRDACIQTVTGTGYTMNFASRNKGNTAGAVQDIAVDGVYGALDAKCKNGPPRFMVINADKIYNHSTGDELVVTLGNGVLDV